MGKTDLRVDAYIDKSAPFAQEILNHIRELVHNACPEIEEKIKWGFPHFDYNGEMCCSMAGFKQHCSFGFWKASLMKDKHKLFESVGETAMGHFGRITSLKDLPSDKIMIEYIKEAVQLNKDGIKIKSKPKKEQAELVVPGELVEALKKNKAALATFEKFSYSCKKEYTMWIAEAKTEATKEKRIATAIEWMAEGKDRNWKYK